MLKALIKGLITYLPGYRLYLKRRKNSFTNHSSSSALFCYNLWLRTLVFLYENKIESDFVRIGEVGNGGSYGVGFCSLLTGVKKYFSFEVNENFSIQENLLIFNEIVELFRDEVPISKSYSQINIRINDFSFPKKLIKPLYDDNHYVSEIRNEIQSGLKEKNKISFLKSWPHLTSLNLDFIFSRAVMEHVNRPVDVYSEIAFHLVPNGYTMHDIECHSHGLSKHPTGHLRIPNILWKLIFGKRDFFLNRFLIIDHVNHLQKLNFKILSTQETISFYDDTVPIIIGGTILAQKR
jgi:hypothetical protein